MRCPRRTAFAAGLASLALAAVAPTVPAGAAVLHVNSTADAVDVRPGDGLCRSQAGACTIRAAVQEANALAGPDTVRVPAGVHALAIPARGVNPASSGDLDVLAPITIVGAGAGATVLDGGPPPPGSPPERRGLDRLLEVHPGAGDVSLSALTIRDGYSAAHGGGVRTASRGTVRLQDVRVTSSFAALSGGAVVNAGRGRLELVASRLTASAAGRDGGGASNAGGGTLVGDRTTITRNTAAGRGGGVANGAGGDLRLTGTTVSDNRAGTGGGGGLASAGAGRVEITTTVLATNAATGHGGAIRLAGSGAATIAETTVRANTASGYGGGLANQAAGALAVSRSALYGNAAGRSGGGVYTAARAPAEIVNSTLSGNSASASGGGLRSGATAPLRVVSSTLFGNSAPAGGAVAHLAGGPAARLVLRNTIVAGGGCAGAIGSEGGNIDSGRSCAFTAAGDRSGADPLLGALAANGGRTPSHAPRAGSPAIDGGISPCPVVDQRGAARPQGLRCDSGAVELPPSPAACSAANATLTAVADAWIDQGSPSANKGSDATLRLAADPLSAARALVSFRLPPAIPRGCVVESARLRLFASSGDDESRLEVRRAAAAWQERAVTWSSQPATAGVAATAHSGDGYLTWDVAAQVQAMLAGAPNHGFLIRDAEEEADDGGETELHSREKGETPPLLVLRFAPPVVGPPPPPAPPQPATVTCGQELTRSTRVMNDLTDCQTGDGLVIGSHRIIVDLGGHTIDGVGLGTGIRNDGYESVTIVNGRVREWDHGVQLQAGTRGGGVRNVTAEGNEVTGIQLWSATGVELRSNTIADNGDGIALLAGTTGALVADNALTANRGAHVLLKDARTSRVERNRVAGEGGGDLGIELLRSTGNTLLANSVSGTSDGGIALADGSDGNRVAGSTLSGTGDGGILVEASHRNRVEGNVLTETGDAGIHVDASRETVLTGNRASGMSDSGISLTAADDGIVRGNTVQANAGGIQLEFSSRNAIDGNDASRNDGIGIELGGGSLDNDVSANTASANASDGILVVDGGNTLTANLAVGNGGWGINAAPGTIDGGGNTARGNAESRQCAGVSCRAATSSRG